MAAIVVLACIAALIELLWCAQHVPGWAGNASLYILLAAKYIVILAVSIAVIAGIGYIVHIKS